MADLNKVFLMGRLTFDPELRYAPSGSAVSELRLAVNRVRNGPDGERKEEVLFIDVTIWDRQAENCCQYLKKGSPIHVEGSLRMDTWDDKSTGEKRSKIRVHADRVQFLDSRRGDPQDDAGNAADDDASASSREASPRRAPAPAPAGRASSVPSESRAASESSAYPSGSSSHSSNVSVGAHDDEAEDIPF